MRGVPGLEEGLKTDAMADLRQAALFMPWALLQVRKAVEVIFRLNDCTASMEASNPQQWNILAPLTQSHAHPPTQRDDYVASVEVRKGYLSLNAHIQDLQNAALMAAEKENSAERVQQAFILMSASLDEWVCRGGKGGAGGGRGVGAGIMSTRLLSSSLVHPWGWSLSFKLWYYVWGWPKSIFDTNITIYRIYTS